jgi:hypothetical protein
MSADRMEILSADELGRTLNRLASQVLESVADSQQLAHPTQQLRQVNIRGGLSKGPQLGKQTKMLH